MNLVLREHEGNDKPLSVLCGRAGSHLSYAAGQDKNAIVFPDPSAWC